MSDSDDGALPVGVRGGVSSRSAPCFVSAEPDSREGIRKSECKKGWVKENLEFKNKECLVARILSPKPLENSFHMMSLHT